MMIGCERCGLVNVVTVTVDTAAPEAPVITGFADNSGSTSDSITNDNTVTLTITAEAGSTVSVVVPPASAMSTALCAHLLGMGPGKRGFHEAA